MNGRAAVFLHASGGVSVTMEAAYGAAHMAMQINTDSLRAFANLLNEAVDALPVESNLHPIMAQALAQFVDDPE